MFDNWREITVISDMSKDIKLSELSVNPRNPRFVNDDKFKKLCESIKNFPKIMEKRPIVYDKDMVILGGTMRYRACLANGMQSIPISWVSSAKDFTPAECREFVVKDNLPYGETDWDILAADYEIGELLDWGMDTPDINIDKNEIEVGGDDLPEYMTFIVNAEQKIIIEKALSELSGENQTEKLICLCRKK